MKRVALILLLLVSVCSAFAQHPKKAVKAYEAAEEAFLKHDYKKAHQQVLKAVTEDPNYAEAWLLEGEIGMEAQDARIFKKSSHSRVDSINFSWLRV